MRNYCGGISLRCSILSERIIHTSLWIIKIIKEAYRRIAKTNEIVKNIILSTQVLITALVNS